MSRLSSYLLPTLRRTGDAEALSHRLMMRAGLIRQLEPACDVPPAATGP